MSPTDKIPTTKEYPLFEFYKNISPLVIPRWQREYSWKSDEHVLNLLEDLTEFYEDWTKKEKNFYLLGQVIVVLNDENEFEVVDGQQRLTTLFLIFISLYTRLNQIRNVEDVVENNYFSNLHQILFDKTGSVKLNNEFHYGTKLIQDLANNNVSNLDAIENSQKNLVEAYSEINEYLKDNFTEKEELLKLIELLCENVWLTKLEISDIPSAMDYFEKLNRRGLELSPSDLLKNYMFASIDDEQYDDLTKNWTTIQKTLGRVNKKPFRSMEFFIKTLATAKSGEKLHKKEKLLKFWRDYIYDDSPEKLNENVHKFIDELSSTSEKFKQLADSKNPFKSDKNITDAANYFNGQQHIPILLSGLKFENSFEYFADLVDRRFMVYIFTKERTASFENFSTNWISKILELDKDATESEILGESQKVNGFKVPKLNETISNNIEVLSYENSFQLKRIRFILSKVSHYLDREAKTQHSSDPFEVYSKVAPSKGSDGIHLDHIYEQQHFKNSKDPFERNRYHSIGNLTLLYKRQHLARNKNYNQPSQKEDLYQNSNYILTKALGRIRENDLKDFVKVITRVQQQVPFALNDWNVEKVASRTRYITKEFLESVINSSDFES